MDYDTLIHLWYGFGYSGENFSPSKISRLSMKSIKLSVLGMALIVVIASCSKKDAYSDETISQDSSIKSSAAAAVDNNSWHTTAQWESAKQDNYSVYYFNIADAKITSDVASDGLVLVYKKQGGTSVAMPYEEKSGDNSVYWYHQVTDGNLLILSDSYNKASQPGADASFKYLIVTPDQLKSLDAQGHSRSNLMDMTYEQASKLLSSNS